MQLRKHSQRGNRRGAMLILVAITMFAFLVTAAFSVDIAYMHLVRTELRSATDAAAKAAAEQLARTQDGNAAVARGIELARRNTVGGKQLQLKKSDFVLGRSTKDNKDRFDFDPAGKPVNSVRVNAARNAGSPDGPVPLFFGRMLNVHSFQPAQTATVTFLERDIVVVVDRSGSMLDDNKFKGLKDAMDVFLAILDKSPTEERVGLASYSTYASADVKMTSNLQSIRTAMSKMKAEGYTNISGGMDAGDAILQSGRSSDFVERAMIVLTDGLQNVGRPATQAAQSLAGKGVMIHTITFGRDADRNAMRQVATIAKGRSYHAADNAELKKVFADIATTFTTIMTK